MKKYDNHGVINKSKGNEIVIFVARPKSKHSRNKNYFTITYSKFKDFCKNISDSDNFFHLTPSYLFSTSSRVFFVIFSFCVFIH